MSRGEVPGSEPAMSLKKELATVLADHPLTHWLEVFEKVDCCVTPVLHLHESLAHPLLKP